MAKYHITAEKLREKYDLKTFADKNPINLNLILDCMRGCNQLRQTKVIESFFQEIFKEASTEYIEIDGKFGKFQKLKVIE